MSFEARNGVETTVGLHACRDASGLPVTGQAGAIISSLWAPDGSSSGLTVTVSEEGATGFYSAAFTPDAVGNWRLELQNPAFPVADGQTSVFYITVLAGMVGDTAKDLTNRTNVKRYIWPENDPVTENTSYDDFIDLLIPNASSYIHNRLDRCLVEDTYTEYYNGTGLSFLQLRQGPLVSVTSVDYVTYSGTTSRSEDLDPVNEGDRLEHGLRAEGHVGLGGLEIIGSFWLTGKRNVRVVYTAGFATIPESIVRAATELVVSDFWLRVVKPLQQQSVENAITTVTAKTPEELMQLVDDAIAPYRIMSYV